MHPKLTEPRIPAVEEFLRPAIRILLLEDDDSYAQFVCHHLDKIGWVQAQVELVGTLGEALARLEAEGFDLVISDLNLPDSRGIATIEALARLCQQPIIGITAEDEPSLHEHAVRVGAYEFLNKSGLNRASLERALRLAVMQSRALHSLRESEAALRQSNERLAKTFRASPNACCIVRLRDNMLLDINESHTRLHGYSAEEAMGRTALALGLWAEPERRAAFVDLLHSQGWVRNYEYRSRTRRGEIRTVLLSAEKVDLDNEPCMITVENDITERIEAEERIRYLAQHDALTGLPNRLLFQDRVNQAVAQTHRSRQAVAVLFIDLDHFKHINDSLGHQVGDQVLRVAGARLQRCLREGDSVSRLGGDEFVICLPGIAHSQDAAVVASKALNALERPFEVEGRELHVGASIGISLSPDDGMDATALMRAADTAMYHAKEKGRGHYRFFTAALNEAAQHRLSLANDLRQALTRGEFVLHYQPQVDLDSGRVFSVEALLRWQRPGEEPMSCGEFIGVAEDTGLILPIGEWALREACAQLQRWRAGGFPDLQMAVNLSARQFYQASFHEVVAQVLRSSGLPPSALELEITESVLLLPSQENLVTLERLAAMGVRLSVDDFGTGYSSLAYLQRFPIHALKIDRSFVTAIGEDERDTAIVTAIIAMAQSLRLKVIAEGVETAGQVAFLTARGCLAGQGYFYGRPMTAEAFAQLLAKPAPHALRA